jgi:hypothetical protein
MLILSLVGPLKAKTFACFCRGFAGARFHRYERLVLNVAWTYNHSNLMFATIRHGHRKFEHVVRFHDNVVVTLRSLRRAVRNVV